MSKHKIGFIHKENKKICVYCGEEFVYDEECSASKSQIKRIDVLVQKVHEFSTPKGLDTLSTKEDK